MRLALVAALLFLAAFAAPAGATTIGSKDVRCPACGKAFPVFVVMSSNDGGGADFDLCSHAAGREPRELAVWTCPRCLFSRWGSTFTDPVAPAVAKRVREELASPIAIAADASQTDIPAWLRYRLALRVATWEEKPAGDRAWIALSGARADRTFFRSFGRSIDEIEEEALLRAGEGLGGFRRCRRDLLAARILLERSRDREPGDADAARDVVLAGALLRFRGEDKAAGRLREVADDETLPASVRNGAGEVLDAARREAELRGVYLELEAEALAGAKERGADLAVRRFTYADALRRAGRAEEAVAGYRLALGTPDAPAWLVVLLDDIEGATGFVPLPADERAGLRRVVLARTLARLRDPDAADDAAADLRMLNAPGAIPEIMAALADESPAVRAAAGNALSAFDDPGPLATDALGKTLLADPDPDAREAAARALAAIAAPRTRGLLERALRAAGKDADELDAVIEALGRIGGTETIGLLLPRYDACNHDVEIAVSRLLNREIEDVEEYVARWPADRHRAHEALVLEGFAAAGYAIDDLRSDAALPALVDALDDDRDCVRWSAFRALRDLTGLSIGRGAFSRATNFAVDFEARRAAAARWRRALNLKER